MIATIKANYSSTYPLAVVQKPKKMVVEICAIDKMVTAIQICETQSAAVQVIKEAAAQHLVSPDEFRQYEDHLNHSGFIHMDHGGTYYTSPKVYQIIDLVVER